MSARALIEVVDLTGSDDDDDQAVHSCNTASAKEASPSAMLSSDCIVPETQWENGNDDAESVDTVAVSTDHPFQSSIPRYQPLSAAIPFCPVR